MKIPIINSKRQYETIAKEAEKAVLEVMRSGSYILGNNNKEFENEICKYLNVKHAVTLNSGTDALHLALRALDIGEGDEEKVAIMSKEDAEKLADFILSVLQKDNQ